VQRGSTIDVAPMGSRTLWSAWRLRQALKMFASPCLAACSKKGPTARKVESEYSIVPVTQTPGCIHPSLRQALHNSLQRLSSTNPRGTHCCQTPRLNVHEGRFDYPMSPGKPKSHHESSETPSLHHQAKQSRCAQCWSCLDLTYHPDSPCIMTTEVLEIRPGFSHPTKLASPSATKLAISAKRRPRPGQSKRRHL